MAIDIKLSKKTKGLVKDLAKRYKRYGDDVNKATALGMNWLAWDVRTAERDAMLKVFDRPTPFTLGSIGLVGGRNGKARPDKLSVSVAPKIEAERYLLPEVEGGTRRKKRSEHLLAGYYVPSKYAQLNQYGNYPPHKLNAVLANTGKAFDKAQRTPHGKKTKYFMGKTKTGKRAVMVHYGPIEANGAQRFRPELLLVSRPPTYRTRLPWFDIGQRVLRAKFDRTMERAFRKFKF